MKTKNNIGNIMAIKHLEMDQTSALNNQLVDIV